MRKELEKALSIIDRNTKEWYYINSLINNAKAREGKVKNKDMGTVRDNLDKGYTATRFGTSEKATKQLVEDLKTAVQQLNELAEEMKSRDIEFMIREIKLKPFMHTMTNDNFPLEVDSVTITNSLL